VQVYLGRECVRQIQAKDDQNRKARPVYGPLKYQDGEWDHWGLSRGLAVVNDLVDKESEDTYHLIDVSSICLVFHNSCHTLGSCGYIGA
jgi:hypothetical protein